MSIAPDAMAHYTNMTKASHYDHFVYALHMIVALSGCDKENELAPRLIESIAVNALASAGAL